MKSYDVIVLGTGGVGSAAAYHLARGGAKVLGLDRFDAGHARGSSHGQTRIIRKAYFEHPDYVPLLERAYELWSELETRSNRQLYFPVGLIEVGPPDGVVVPGVLTSAQQHGLRVERLPRSDFTSRCPGFTLPAGHEAVFEQDAGYLLVEDCVRTHASEATKLGANLRSGEAVTGWAASGDTVTVSTSANTYAAGSLIITAGAWASEFLRDFDVSFRILRKHLHWYAGGTGQYDAAADCPVFFYETSAGFFYGFPAIDDRGLKVAEHSGGTEIEDPLNDDRTVEPEVNQRIETFLHKHLPGVSGRPTDHAVCFYTVSPDEHFVVDRHPHHANVAFAAGLSGHGFKFTSVLGEVLAGLATEQRPSQPIDFLSWRRFT